MLDKLTAAGLSFIALAVLHAPLAGAHGEDDPVLVMVMLDELELRDVGAGDDKAWDGQAWVGKDLAKLWLKSKGERSSAESKEAELQILYSIATATYWDIQFGMRQDVEPSPNRSWLAIGFQGLAPYFFDVETVLFIGEAGRTALRFEAEYELLLTQRLILTPEIEINLFGKDDPEVRVGSGLSDIDIGLRMRYEIRRELAPYVGVTSSRLYGSSADFAAAAGRETSETQFTIGVRVRF